jgi:hypothetical protein
MDDKLPRFKMNVLAHDLVIVGDSAINCWGSPETVADAEARAQQELDSYPPGRNMVFNGKKLKRSKATDPGQ